MIEINLAYAFSVRRVLLLLLAFVLASCASNYSSMSTPTPVVTRGGEFDVSVFLQPAGLDVHGDYSPIEPLVLGASGALSEGSALTGELRAGLYHPMPIGNLTTFDVAAWAAYGEGWIHQTTNQGELHVGGPEVLETGNTRRRSVTLMLQLIEEKGFHIAFEARYSWFKLSNGVRTYLGDSGLQQNYPRPQDISGDARFLEEYFVVGFPVARNVTLDLQLGLPRLESPEPPFGWNEIVLALGLQYHYRRE